MGQKLFIFRIYVRGALLLRGQEILQQACDVFVCSCKQILDSQYILEVDGCTGATYLPIFFFFLITEIEGNTNYVSRLETLSTAPDMSSRHKKIFFKYYVFG